MTHCTLARDGGGKIIYKKNSHGIVWTVGADGLDSS